MRAREGVLGTYPDRWLGISWLPAASGLRYKALAQRRRRLDGGRGARLAVAPRTGAVAAGTVSALDDARRRLQASQRPLGIETL